jgi:hypothetical protein
LLHLAKSGLDLGTSALQLSASRCLLVISKVMPSALHSIKHASALDNASFPSCLVWLQQHLLSAASDITRKNLALTLLLICGSFSQDSEQNGAKASSVLSDADSDVEENIRIPSVSKIEVEYLSSILKQLSTVLVSGTITSSSTSRIISAASTSRAKSGDAKAIHGALVATGLLGARLRKLTDSEESMLHSTALDILPYLAPEKAVADPLLTSAATLAIGRLGSTGEFRFEGDTTSYLDALLRLLKSSVNAASLSVAPSQPESEKEKSSSQKDQKEKPFTKGGL